MIIVSQDKKITVENLNLGIREAGEYNQNCVIYNIELGADLGEYKTEERAKEVLKEITNTFSAAALNGTYDEIDLILKAKFMARYEMPEE